MADDFRRTGALRERMHFQSRPVVDDGWGDQTQGAGDFETIFTRAAGLRPRVGGEAVTAARLDGRQPFIVTVRHTRQMADVTTAWRLLDARNVNRVFNVMSPPADPDGRNQWLEFLVEEGRVS